MSKVSDPYDTTEDPSKSVDKKVTGPYDETADIGILAGTDTVKIVDKKITGPYDQTTEIGILSAGAPEEVTKS